MQALLDESTSPAPAPSSSVTTADAALPHAATRMRIMTPLDAFAWVRWNASRLAAIDCFALWHIRSAIACLTGTRRWQSRCSLGRNRRSSRTRNLGHMRLNTS